VFPLAALAALIGEFIFVGLLLIGMDLNFDVDMHLPQGHHCHLLHYNLSREIIFNSNL
jgi:hypothetical protein